MKNKKIVAGILSTAMAMSMLSGCGSAAGNTDTPVSASEKVVSDSSANVVDTQTATSDTQSETESDAGNDTAALTEAPEIAGLTYESTMSLEYAECFQVFYYQGGYALINIVDEGQFLVVPEGMSAPDGLDSSIVVLQQPVQNIYMVATSAMSLFDAIDALDTIRLSGTDADGWYVENAKTAMENGEILYAGKYSEPDYELLLNEGTQLAIESTMILHSPEVKEKLEELGIPVLIDRSSYESHPLGRTEWMKLYAVLTGKEETATEKFDEQSQVVTDLSGFENTGKTVAFFYVSSTGNVVVRKSNDYVPKMIDLAGGSYIYNDLGGDDNALSSVNVSMEEFYNTAKDVDYLVYNATIDEPLTSLDDLYAKSELFADFIAVKEGHVWSTGKSMYQETDILGEMISDLHTMLTDDSATQLKFMTKLQ